MFGVAWVIRICSDAAADEHAASTNTNALGALRRQLDHDLFQVRHPVGFR